MSALGFDTLVSDLAPVAGAPLPDGGTPHWSPLTHTLVFGETEAALIDPPITAAQTDHLADWVASHNRRLTTIYLTHAHADHWLGTAQLLRRFPDATVFAGVKAAELIAAQTAEGAPGALWAALFPGQLPADIEFPVHTVPPEGLLLDGERLHSIEVGHSDTDDTTVLHVPSIELVAAGDIVYNNVHLYLAEARNGGFEAWHHALDVVAELHPSAVVAGHKDARRDDSPTNITETHRYLEVAERTLAASGTRLEFVTALMAAFPDRVNPYTLWLSASRLFEA